MACPLNQPGGHRERAANSEDSRAIHPFGAAGEVATDWLICLRHDSSWRLRYVPRTAAVRDSGEPDGMIMYNDWVYVVLTMRPSHSDGAIKSLEAQRNRLVLVALAQCAEPTGISMATMAELAAMSCHTVESINTALSDLARGQILTMIDRSPLQIICELNRSKILDQYLEIEQSFYQLVPFGLSAKPLAALLQSSPYDNLDQLANVIERYLKIPAHGRMPLDQYLKIPGFGPKGGEKLLAAYVAWKAETRLPAPRRVQSQARRGTTEG